MKLVDVIPPSVDFPPGFDLNLTDGVIRMSYRKGRPDRDLITPGRVYDVDVKLFPTANVFKRGQ